MEQLTRPSDCVHARSATVVGREGASRARERRHGQCTCNAQQTRITGVARRGPGAPECDGPSHVVTWSRPRAVRRLRRVCAARGGEPAGLGCHALLVTLSCIPRAVEVAKGVDHGCARPRIHLVRWAGSARERGGPVHGRPAHIDAELKRPWSSTRCGHYARVGRRTDHFHLLRRAQRSRRQR